MASDPMNKAEKAFKREEQRREGARNLADYQQAQAAAEKKTERLRALRLAHEAELAKAAAYAPAKKTKSRSRKKVSA